MSQQTTYGFSRRAFLQRVALASAGLTLAACTPVAPSAGDQAAPGAAAEELDVLVCCYAPPDLEIRDKVNADFEAANPAVKLNQELLPAGQNYFEKLQTLIAANTPPDVFDMWEGYVVPYAENGAILNLEPFLEADSKLKRDDLLPAAIDTLSWQNQLYALMIGFIPGPVSLYYNTAHFSEAGLDMPTAEWTWNDVRTAAQALTQDPDRWGVTFDLWFVQWLYWIWSNGWDVFNADATASTLSDAAAVEALQWWADLVNQDQVALAPSMLASMQGGLNAFQIGAVSMYVGNAWDVGTLKSAQDLAWQAVLSPKANNGQRVWYTHLQCWAISTQAAQPEAAWSYIRDFVLAYEPAIQEIAPTIPGVKSLLPAFDNETTRSLGYQPLIELVTQPGVLRIPGSGAKWDKIAGMIQAELDLVFTGEKSAADAAATVTPQIDAELART